MNETVFPADSGADKIGKLFEQILTRAGGSPGAVSKAIPREFLTVEGLPDWNVIPPEILGDIFQDIMTPEKRHDIGAHYTSERNILKLIHPLFLDGLREEFESIKKLSPSLREERLKQFHEKLCALKFLDPACGCGNFLAVAYRELRLLEIEVISLLTGKERTLDISTLVKVNVNQFYGIEIEEFPAQIAQTAMWLTDHQMNLKVSETFGRYFVRIPLTAAAHIHNTNALTTDWENIIPKEQLSYILGNPPFIGCSVMSKTQKNELRTIFAGWEKYGMLDYVTCWYKKAACYMKGTNIETAFVSTNSICQGEQVPCLWPELFHRSGITINFAHQTFKWRNEARGNAAVYCVIIGFSRLERAEKRLFVYDDIRGKPREVKASQINAYLLDAPNVFIERRLKPLCGVSEILLGNVPRDDGNFFLDKSQRAELLKKEPALKPLIRPFLGSIEFLHNLPRYCLWFDGVSPAVYKNSKEIKERLARIRKFREASERETTRKMAEFPSLFSENRQPKSHYLLIPSVSSERRKYIPIGFVRKNTICGNSCHMIPNAALYEFGVLESLMHMAWTRYVCGRLGNGLRYSGVLVYNNFPWPSSTEKQKQNIERYAQMVLDARKENDELTLADLYDNDLMPTALKKAHQALDKAVDAAYGRTFANDSERVAYLFELYQKLSGELFRKEQKRGKGRKA